MQVQELKIGYKSSGSNYEVVMVSKIGAAFDVVAQNKKLKGEALVQKILDTVPEDIAAVMRYRDGEKSDGPKGEPCYEKNFTRKGNALSSAVDHVCGKKPPKFSAG